LQTILVSDDELNIRNILDFSLEAEGYRVIAAADGEEAFEMAVREKPDLIILDVMMPRGDGFSVCRQLKNDPRTADIPVILLTARSGRTDRDMGTRVRADDYITKPFSPQRLVAKVQSLLGVPKG
jgi:DNA-binding response OmpR family regulator